VGTEFVHLPLLRHLLRSGPLRTYPSSHVKLATLSTKFSSVVEVIPLTGVPGSPHDIPGHVQIVGFNSLV